MAKGGSATVVERDITSITDAANMAWSERAEKDGLQRAEELRRKLSPALNVKRDEYEVDLDRFPEEVTPRLRVGVEIDGQTFCLTKEGHLAVVAWRCEHKDCGIVERAPFIDLTTLGKALAYGAKTQYEQPRCRHHP